MKFTTLFTSLSLLFGAVAQADQSPTLTCTGPNVILSVKSPYLGENSRFEQKLYVLKSLASNDNESAYTAYFLDVSEDGGKFGALITVGKNEQGGTFTLLTKYFEEDSNGTTPRYTTRGSIEYNHGPLKGSETVSCVLE